MPIHAFEIGILRKKPEKTKMTFPQIEGFSYNFYNRFATDHLKKTS